MPSAFDPKTFLDRSTDTAFDTARTNVPEGDHHGIIKSVTAEEVTIQTGQRAGQKAYKMFVTWSVDDPKVREVTGLAEPSVRQDFFIDLTPTGAFINGANMNVDLGKLRDAVGQNKAGKQWRPSMLIGSAALIHVTHRTVDQDRDGNPLAEPRVFAEVKKVAKL